MPPRRTQQQVIDDLAARYGPAVAKAFEEAISDIRSNAEVQRIIRAISQGNIEAALDALHLDPAAFDKLAEALRQTYAAGGNAITGFMPSRTAEGLAAVHRFTVGDQRAADFIARYSADLVTRITDETRETVREHLADAMAKGQNPTAAALDIVGRVNRATGQREGGVVGLSGPQAAYVRNARAELESGDPANLRAYLGRERRDKRFDRSVQKAIREGKPIPAETRERMLNAYEGRLLKLRGEIIGRTEAMTALQQGSNEAYRQAIAAGRIRAEDVKKAWVATFDRRTRDTHGAMHGQTVGFDEPFVSPSGARMLYPMDRSLGAPASEVVGCRCWCRYEIDYFSRLR